MLGESHGDKTGDGFDSDRETVIEDEMSSCASESENELEDVLRDWNMNCTLMDDPSFKGSGDFDIDSLDYDYGYDSLIERESEMGLMSIPEESAVCHDLVGNEVHENESSSVCLDYIEQDAARWTTGNSAGKQEIDDNPTSGSIKAVDQKSERRNNALRRPVSHREAVEAIMDRSIHFRKNSHQARNRHSKADFSDILREDEVACEVVIPDLSRIVKPSGKEQEPSLPWKDDVKVSSGCCAGFKKFSSFSKARGRLEALGRAFKKHWPIITSAVVPFVLFFSCRRQ